MDFWGISGEDDGRYKIAGDNGERCESKRRGKEKGKESRTDEIIWRLWRGGAQVRKAQVVEECVEAIGRESDGPLPMKTSKKTKQDDKKYVE